MTNECNTYVSLSIKKNTQIKSFLCGNFVSRLFMILSANWFFSFQEENMSVSFSRNMCIANVINVMQDVLLLVENV